MIVILKRIHLLTVVSFLFLPLSVPVPPFSLPEAHAGSHEGYTNPVAVKRVLDGDTIELLNGERVRYLGVDAPEIHQKVKGRWVRIDEPFSREAYEFNRGLVEGRKIRLEFDREIRDRFNRLLAYVFVGEEMVNAELIEEGLARVMIRPPNLKYEESFKEIQKEARIRGRGLWGIQQNQ